MSLAFCKLWDTSDFGKIVREATKQRCYSFIILLSCFPMFNLTNHVGLQPQCQLCVKLWSPSYKGSLLRISQTWLESLILKGQNSCIIYYKGDMKQVLSLRFSILHWQNNIPKLYVEGVERLLHICLFEAGELTLNRRTQSSATWASVSSFSIASCFSFKHSHMNTMPRLVIAVESLSERNSCSTS